MKFPCGVKAGYLYGDGNSRIADHFRLDLVWLGDEPSHTTDRLGASIPGYHL